MQCAKCKQEMESSDMGFDLLIFEIESWEDHKDRRNGLIFSGSLFELLEMGAWETRGIICRTCKNNLVMEIGRDKIN